MFGWSCSVYPSSNDKRDKRNVDWVSFYFSVSLFVSLQLAIGVFSLCCQLYQGCFAKKHREKNFRVFLREVRGLQTLGAQVRDKPLLKFVLYL